MKRLENLIIRIKRYYLRKEVLKLIKDIDKKISYAESFGHKWYRNEFRYLKELKRARNRLLKMIALDCVES